MWKARPMTSSKRMLSAHYSFSVILGKMAVHSKWNCFIMDRIIFSNRS